jgi:allene oxide cyclase
VVEHAATDLVIDLGDTGDSLGDQLVFGNDLYDAANTAVVGRDQGNCFRTNPGVSWECTWTNILADG